jgi:hypothetical protein
MLVIVELTYGTLGRKERKREMNDISSAVS